MLNRNHMGILFTDTDINVPVTIFSECFKQDNASCHRSVWFSTIKESLGPDLTKSEQTYHFQITTIKGKVYSICSTGSQFINELRSLLSNKAPMSIRIDILEDSDRSWIIILKSDLTF